jgi:stearoyl-CoA 9-desaturase NADPH oxidoreductase
MFTATLPRRAVRRAIGAIDALAAPHGVDRYLEQVFPTWSSTEVRGRVVAVDRSAAGSVRLTIEPNGSWTGFRAGQHTQLSVEIDGVRHTRCYSMCSSAGERRFELGIKAQPEGLVSRHLLAEAEPGMVVGLTPAAGSFHLPDVRPERVLLISGGSGITPVLSMLRTLCAEGHDGPVTFLHYNAAPDAVIAREQIAELAWRHPNVRVISAFEHQPDEGDLVGLLSEDHLAAADPQWRDAETFVCGPAPLMDAARALYDAAGAGHRLHQEAFTLPDFVGEAGTVGGSVRFGTTDLVISNDGRPLLEQAEAAGLTPEHGCRMGICHTCTRSLTTGCVRDAVTGELTSERDVEIRICVSVPVGDVEIDL